MPSVMLNGKPDQEFPEEQEFEAIDFQEVAHELSVAAGRLKDRSDTMEQKYKILSTRLAAAEAATTHLLNQLELVRTDNAALRAENQTLQDRMGIIESTISLLNRKIHKMSEANNPS